MSGDRTPRRSEGRWPAVWRALAVAALVGLGAAELPAQRDGEPPPRAGRRAAVIDLTGYWVAVVTEDWRWRMLTPPKGDYDSLPLNDEGRRVADTWDLDRDYAEGNQCRAFGAAAILRTPTRLHITWEDDLMLRIDADNGTQTRRVHFAPGDQPQSLVAMIASRSPQEATWQGYSVGEWETLVARRGGAGRRGRGPGAGPGGGLGPGDGREGGPADDPDAPPPGAAQGVPNPPPGRGGGRGAQTRGGSLRVMTTRMRAGYLRANGVPYSEHAVLTELFDRFTTETGEEWFVVTSIVEDPQYLTGPFVTTSHFKQEPDDAKWRPTPCETPPPTRDGPIETGL